MTRFRILATCFALAALAACGVDGAPERPEPRPTSDDAVPGA